MSKERVNISKRKALKVVVTNSSNENARMTLEEIIKRYLLKKASQLKDDVA